MKLNTAYAQQFGKIPILGMIHLAGDTPIKRALEEIAIFEEEGIDGAIIENYHGSTQDVVETLKETHKRKPKLIMGINILPNEFAQSFLLTQEYNLDFVQLDHVAGNYTNGSLDFESYKNTKNKYSNKIVLGGIWPKYYRPIHGSNLEADLKLGMQRAEAIVVTGSGTGKETPLEKIMSFRKILGNHPLIIGAGLTVDNAYEQLCIADGAIVGTSLKLNNKTSNPIDRQRVKDFMQVVKSAREYKKI